MNFYERNKEKLFFLFVFFFILTFFLPHDIKDNISDFFSGLPTGLLAFLIVICIFVFASFVENKRSVELGEYAKKHNYCFYKKPNEAQISLFKEFKSIKTVSNRDIFLIC